MSINASALRAGMHIDLECAYIRVERIAHETCGMIRATIPSALGGLATVVFHSDETITIGA